MPEHTAIGLLNRAPSGIWKSGELAGGDTMTATHDLPFGGPADDDRGFVRRDEVPLENGDERRALRTHPKWVPDGTIKGWIPVADAPADAVFEADVGFLRGARATDGVEFQVWAHYDDGGSLSLTEVASSWKEYTGSLERLRADLSSFGTSLRKIELRVDAGGGGSAQDWAAWVDPVVFDGSTASNTVSGFLPSTCGLHFVNYFDAAAIPDRRVRVPDPFGGGTAARLEVPDDYGLCGGMTFAVKDYYEADVSPWSDDLLDRRPDDSPTAERPPAKGSPLFSYLWDRLFDTFEHGTVARFVKLMHPAFRDTESQWFQGDANRADVIRAEWHTVCSRIDEDELVPLGIVQEKTANPFQVFYNHQVLAYGYEMDGTEATVHVYDPNCPRNDQVRITFPWRDPAREIRARYHRHYVEQASGTLEGLPVSDNPADTVDGTAISGRIREGNDGYRFSGALRHTQLDDPSRATVLVDGEPAPWFGAGERTVVIQGHSDEPVEYDFGVSGWVTQERGSVDGRSVSKNPGDRTTVHSPSGWHTGSTASGAVKRGADGFTFDGEITHATVSDPEKVTVFVDGEQVDQFRGVGEYTGERTLVIEGDAPNGMSYSFDVASDDDPDDTIYAFFAIDYSQGDPPTNW